MAERLGAEQRAVGDEHRKRIARILVRVHRQCRKRLELADHAQPFDNVRTVRSMPSVDRNRELIRDEQRGRDGHEEKVVHRRFTPRDQLREARDRAGRRDTLRRQCRLQRHETRRADAFSLDANHQLAEHREIDGRLSDALGHDAQRLAPAVNDGRFDEHQAEDE